MPTYSNAGTLVDSAISAGAGGTTAYLVEKALASGQGDFVQTNMMTKLGILVLANMAFAKKYLGLPNKT